MTVVAPGDSFTVTFITTESVDNLGSFVLTNKNTNVSTTLSPTYYDSDYYGEADVVHTVAEGEFFKYELYNAQDELVHVGSVFCTAQSDYSINNGNYVSNTTENEYITR
jgi:hypothetical protein